MNGLNVGTYVSSTRPDGTLEGEGQGVFAGVFEFEVSADGTTRARIWEWK